jgi:hypothetical protein
MPPRNKAKSPDEPKWTQEQLLSVKHMGPAIIGQEMHEAAQKVVKETDSGRMGPAILKTNEEWEADQAAKKAESAPPATE